MARKQVITVKDISVCFGTPAKLEPALLIPRNSVLELSEDDRVYWLYSDNTKILLRHPVYTADWMRRLTVAGYATPLYENLYSGLFDFCTLFSKRWKDTLPSECSYKLEINAHNLFTNKSYPLLDFNGVPVNPLSKTATMSSVEFVISAGRFQLTSNVTTELLQSISPKDQGLVIDAIIKDMLTAIVLRKFK